MNVRNPSTKIPENFKSQPVNPKLGHNRIQSNDDRMMEVEKFEHHNHHSLHTARPNYMPFQNQLEDLDVSSKKAFNQNRAMLNRRFFQNHQNQQQMMQMQHQEQSQPQSARQVINLSHVNNKKDSIGKPKFFQQVL